MSVPEGQGRTAAVPEPAPAPGRLRRRLLERPDARRKVVRAVGSLLGVGIASIGVIGALIIWHLVRRGRLIREGLNPPRVVHLPRFDPTRPETETETDEQGRRK